jgi:hypothetical protein
VAFIREGAEYTPPPFGVSERNSFLHSQLYNYTIPNLMTHLRVI